MELTFEEKIRTSSLPVVVDFWAPWCAPCKMMKPALESAAQEFSVQVQLIQVNTDEETEVARRFNIKSIPTLIGYSQGQEVARRVGAMNANDLRSFFSAVQKGEAFTGIDQRSRTFRLLATAALFVLAFYHGFNGIVLNMAIGMLVFALYDKCPLITRLRNWYKEKKKTA